MQDDYEELEDVDVEDIENDKEANAEKENTDDLLEMLQDRIGQSMSV